MKNSNDAIGNPAGDFPVGSAVKRKLYYTEFRIVLHKYVEKRHNGLFSGWFSVSVWHAVGPPGSQKKPTLRGAGHDGPQTAHRPSIDRPFTHTYSIRLLVYFAVAYKNHLQSGPWRHGLGIVAFQSCVWQSARNHKAIKMKKTRSTFLATRQSVHNCSQLLCLWIRLHAVNCSKQLMEWERRQKRESSLSPITFSHESNIK